MTMFSHVLSTSSRSLLPVLAAVVAAGLLSGCDGTPSSPTADDVSTTANEVVVRSDNFTRADLQFEPVSVPPGESFSISLADNEIGENVTQITHQAAADGRLTLNATFDPLQPASVTVQCRNQNTGTKRTMATLGPGVLAKSGLESVASTSDDPSSWHYIKRGDNIIVEVDYGGQVTPGGIFDFPSEAEPVECTHVGFVLEDVSTPLTADGVRFEGGTKRPAFSQQKFK
jgi:hypothetical protein